MHTPTLIFKLVMWSRQVIILKSRHAGQSNGPNMNRDFHCSLRMKFKVWTMTLNFEPGTWFCMWCIILSWQLFLPNNFDLPPCRSKIWAEHEYVSNINLHTKFKGSVTIQWGTKFLHATHSIVMISIEPNNFQTSPCRTDITLVTLKQIQWQGEHYMAFHHFMVGL